MLVGVAQIEPRLGEAERNLEECLGCLEDAAARGCSLLVLPECSSVGYVFDSAGRGGGPCRGDPGPVHRGSRGSVLPSCSVHCVAGMLEREGDLLRNTAVARRAGRSRRALPQVPPALPRRRPVRRRPATSSRSSTRRSGGSGSEICYDLRFPELTRSLALRGAEIVVHPTNWPLEARSNADVLTRARAHENRVFLLIANRVGTGAGRRVLRLEPDLRRARRPDRGGGRAGKRRSSSPRSRSTRPGRRTSCPAPGKYEMSLFGHRRPDLYGTLVEERTPVH